MNASAWSWSVHTFALGREGAMRAAEGATPRLDAARVLYPRRGWTEWYENSEAGLEQGFTIDHAPEGRGPLRVELAWAGLGARVLEDRVQFVDARGRPVLSYGALAARDALGRALPARLGVEKGLVILSIEDRDAAYPVVIDPLAWGEQQSLVIAGATSQLGAAVAIDGDDVVLGDWADATKGANAGAAHVFVRSGNRWAEQHVLFASDAAPEGRFGASVAVNGDTLAVGSPDVKRGLAGGAYVFVRSLGVWSEQQKLTAPNAEYDSLIGSSVSLSGDTIALGQEALAEVVDGTCCDYRPRAAIFFRSGTTWALQQGLAGGALGQTDFGTVSAVGGDTAVIAATPAGGSGGALAFVRAGAVWSVQQALLPTDAATATDEVGSSVALSGDTAVVGAAGKDSGRGAAYVFVRGGTTWTQQQKLSASDGARQDRFGASVAVSGDTIVVGATDAPHTSGPPAAYIYTRSGTSWTETQKLVAKEATTSALGCSAAISGDTAVYGTCGQGGNGAYVFALRALAAGTPCSSSDQCASTLCVDGVCCDRACNGPCEACDVPGKGGICSPVSGAPHGARTCGGAVCDAENDAGSCKPACTTSDDCVNNAPCIDSACTQGATCSADGLSSNPRQGPPLACSPYRCGANGECGTSCGTSDDCAPGFACRGDTKTCESAAAGSSGSGCGAAPGGSGDARAWLIALAIVLASRRRAR
jgi:hypothetical protein